LVFFDFFTAKILNKNLLGKSKFKLPRLWLGTVDFYQNSLLGLPGRQFRSGDGPAVAGDSDFNRKQGLAGALFSHSEQWQIPSRDVRKTIHGDKGQWAPAGYYFQEYQKAADGLCQLQRERRGRAVNGLDRRPFKKNIFFPERRDLNLSHKRTCAKRTRAIQRPGGTWLRENHRINCQQDIKSDPTVRANPRGINLAVSLRNSAKGLRLLDPKAK
jgi:hypothetical protein